MCTYIKSIPVIFCTAILCVWLCQYVCMWSKMSKMLFSCRYPYYALSVLNIDFPVLSWLRYTVWIPLYPVGFTCEGKSVIWLLARTNSLLVHFVILSSFVLFIYLIRHCAVALTPECPTWWYLVLPTTKSSQRIPQCGYFTVDRFGAGSIQ